MTEWDIVEHARQHVADLYRAAQRGAEIEVGQIALCLTVCADLIEQQSARIAELEERNKLLEFLNDKASKEWKEDRAYIKQLEQLKTTAIKQ